MATHSEGFLEKFGEKGLLDIPQMKPLPRRDLEADDSKADYVRELRSAEGSLGSYLLDGGDPFIEESAAHTRCTVPKQGGKFVGGYFNQDTTAAFHRMVYDDLLLNEARSHTMQRDLLTADATRSVWHSTQRTAQWDRQRLREKEWENELALRNERQKDRIREREYELVRERDWEYLSRQEEENNRERERAYESLKEELRRQWIDEKERMREQEREREADWERELEMERDKMRVVARNWEREKEQRYLKIKQREWEWERERNVLREAWETERKKEQNKEAQLLLAIEHERTAREDAWEKERRTLLAEYTANTESIKQITGPQDPDAGGGERSDTVSEAKSSEAGGGDPFEATRLTAAEIRRESSALSRRSSRRSLRASNASKLSAPHSKGPSVAASNAAGEPPSRHSSATGGTHSRQLSAGSVASHYTASRHGSVAPSVA